jgi:hypothetical protein
MKTTSLTLSGDNESSCAHLISDDPTLLTTTLIMTPIQVTIHYPEHLTESVRQRKINAIYDILKPLDMSDNTVVHN